MNDDVHQEPKTFRNDAPLKRIFSATTKLESQDVKPLRPLVTNLAAQSTLGFSPTKQQTTRPKRERFLGLRYSK